MCSTLLPLTIASLHEQYRRQTLTPAGMIAQVLAGIAQSPLASAWIHLLSPEALLAYTERLSGKSPDTLPLYGIPFAIKDNLDLAGVPTTAACPAYAYVPQVSATVV
jgi:allophanate hydrolase